MKVLQERGWALPIDAQTKKGGIGKTPILRMQATMPQIKAVVKRLREYTIDNKTMDKMIGELDGKAGGNHNSFHLPMTFVFKGTKELHDDGSHTGKTIPGFCMQEYTWGYNYKTLIRVTQYEKLQDNYMSGLFENPHSGRFILSLIVNNLFGDPWPSEEKQAAEVDCLCEILTEWIVNGVDEYGDYAFKPIHWDSEEYPWNQEEYDDDMQDISPVAEAIHFLDELMGEMEE